MYIERHMRSSGYIYGLDLCCGNVTPMRMRSSGIIAAQLFKRPKAWNLEGRPGNDGSAWGSLDCLRHRAGRFLWQVSLPQCANMRCILAHYGITHPGAPKNKKKVGLTTTLTFNLENTQNMQWQKGHPNFCMTVPDDLELVIPFTIM